MCGRREDEGSNSYFKIVNFLFLELQLFVRDAVLDLQLFELFLKFSNIFINFRSLSVWACILGSFAIRSIVLVVAWSTVSVRSVGAVGVLVAFITVLTVVLAGVLAVGVDLLFRARFEALGTEGETFGTRHVH